MAEKSHNKNLRAEIKTHFDNSIGKIDIILQDIGRVLLNLFNNAFYATREKKKGHNADLSEVNYEPEVSVSTKKSGNRVFVTFSDNGNGISKNIIDKIYQPFFTTKPTGEGTGLRLSLSYDIAKAHGGAIKVKSKEKEGSAFVIQYLYFRINYIYGIIQVC